MLLFCDVGTVHLNLRANSSQEGGNDRGLSEEEEFDLGGLNMDGPIIKQGVRDFKKRSTRD